MKTMNIPETPEENYQQQKQILSEPRNEAEPCLKEFTASSDAPGSSKKYQYRCGLMRGHKGACAWRGDCKHGGRIS